MTNQSMRTINKGSSACARMGGSGQAQYDLLVPFGSLAQSAFSFRTISHKTLIEATERAMRTQSRHCERSEQPMRSVSREREDKRFTTGVAPRVDANDGEKGDTILQVYAIYLFISLFCRSEAAKTKP